ncbi:MAG: methyltransferase domain-containing protein [Candidatus Micrarchaeota archaeon]
MKLLYFHAKELRIEAGISGNPSKQRQTERTLRERLGNALPILDTHNNLTESKNALLVFVCAEKEDGVLDLTNIRDDILKSRAMLGVDDIVLGAFGHLSEETADPLLARRIIDDLLSMVQSSYPSTKSFPFGWDKSLDIKVPLHHFNASFKSYGTGLDFWSSVATHFDEYMQETGHYHAQATLLNRFFESMPSSQILDICCGGGFAIHHLTKTIHPENQVFGLDSSEKMLEIARKRSSGSFICGKAEYLDLFFNGHKFDVVLAINAVAYVDMVLVLSRLRKIMKPGSGFIVMEEEPFISGFSIPSDTKIPEELKLAHLSIKEIEKSVIQSGFRLIAKTDSPIDQRHRLVGLAFQLV